MRKIAWILAASMALPFPALAQQGPTRSVDDYVCTFSDDCAEEAEAAPPSEETLTEKGRARVSSTRGFSLARPKAKETTTAAPKAAANRPKGSARTQSAATERPRAKAAAAKPAGAQRRRADLRVNFELGSATLTAQAREEARIFAQALKTPQLNDKRFVIEGHTDSIGGRDYNLDLSRRRAQAVVEFLSSLGVDARRLEVRGYGFDRPLDGRSAASVENRRVEAVLATG